MTPRVTFLMAVHNGAGTVREAVESVLGQTFGDFEFLIVDDGSSDGTGDILRSVSDKRIRVLSNEKNLGLSASLNRGWGEAQGKFVVRMDADDVCMPNRTTVQMAYMERHPGVAVTGSFVETFSKDDTKETIHYPTEPDAVGATLLFRSALAHPAVIIRREALDRHHLRYEEDFRYAQDYALWLSCVRAGLKLANVPEVLLRYRVHPGQLSESMEDMQGEGMAIRTRFLMSWWGHPPLGSRYVLHNAISRNQFVATKEWVRGATRWLERLAEGNKRMPLFDQDALLRILTGRFVALCRFAAAKGLPVPDGAASPFAAFIRPDAMNC